MLLALTAVLCLVWTTSAQASAIVIVRPRESSAELTEALFRLQGELSALGLDVRVIQRNAGQTSRSAEARREPQTLAAADHADALIEVTADGESLGLDVRVFEHTGLRSGISNVVVERTEPDAAKTLAIRTIEVLRSRFLELDLAAAPKNESKTLRAENPAHEPARAMTSDARQDLAPAHVQRVGVAAGAAMLMSLDGVGPAFLPTLRLDWAPRSWLLVDATLAGLGSHPTIESQYGSAELEQSYAVAGLRYSTAIELGIRPFIGIAAGALHTAIDGRTSAPNEGHTIELWSFLMDGSIGVSFPIRAPIYVTLSSHLQLASPYVSVHFIDRVVGSSGRPNLVFAVTAGAWL